MPSTIIDNLRLVGVSGTNKIMAGELSRLARRAFTDRRLSEPKKDGLGSLVYPFDPEAAILAVQYHRTSSRVLWDLFQSKEVRLEPLYDELFAAMCAESRPWFKDGDTISVSVHNVGSFEAGGRQIVGTVKNAVIEGAATQGATLTVRSDEPDIKLDVRVYPTGLTVSVDLAGRPMNQRGYRVSAGPAPLRENLAAVLTMLARYDSRHDVLLDPMAGSATIPIEAACMAKASPVWVHPREPACYKLAPFAQWAGERPRPLFADTKPFIIANEMEPEEVENSRRNIAAAGMSHFIETLCGDFRKLSVQHVQELIRERGFNPGRGVIVCNPPYGERMGADKLFHFYKDLGRWCRRFSGWRAAFLVANRDFEQAFGRRPRIKKPLNNASLRGYFYLYDL